MYAHNVRPKIYSTVGSMGVPCSSRGFKISNAESIDAAIIHTVETPIWAAGHTLQKLILEEDCTREQGRKNPPTSKTKHNRGGIANCKIRQAIFKISLRLETFWFRIIVFIAKHSPEANRVYEFRLWNWRKYSPCITYDDGLARDKASIVFIIFIQTMCHSYSLVLVIIKEKMIFINLMGHLVATCELVMKRGSINERGPDAALPINLFEQCLKVG